MNRDLFLNGFIDRISQRFGLSATFAFEILAIAAVLDMTFDEVIDNVSSMENGSGSHDAGMDGIFIDEEDAVMHVFQVKSGAHLGDNDLAKFVNDYRNLFVFGNATQLPLNTKVNQAFATYQELAQAGRAIETRLHFVFGGEITPQNRDIAFRHLDAHEILTIHDRNDLYEEIESLVAENRKRKPVAFSFMAQKSNISLKSDPQALISFQIQHTLFSGQPNSAIYPQLLRVYQLYRFVVAQRNQAPARADFVMYADELFCYGLHKLGGTDRSLAYQQVHAAIESCVHAEKALYASKDMTYSHNGYFKSAKSRYDLDRLLGFVGANPLFIQTQLVNS